VGIGAERRLTKAASLFPQGGFLSFVAMMIRFVGDCVVPIIILLNPSLFPRYRRLAFLVFISSFARRHPVEIVDVGCVKRHTLWKEF